MSERQPQVGLNIGSSSIIMLFAVLCLTVLAALSLLSANAQLGLSQKAADATADYYGADSIAVDIYNRIAAGDYSQAEETVSGGVTLYEYSVGFGKEQAIAVTVSASGEILRWEVVDLGQWAPDDTLNLFDFDAFD